MYTNILSIDQGACYFCVCQMLFSQDAHKRFAKQELCGMEVASKDLDKFECEIKEMLNIVEKHMESKEDDEKVGELHVKTKLSYTSLTFLSFSPSPFF